MVHKDLKIGLALGLVLVIFAVIKIATDPRLSPKARMMQVQNAAARQDFNSPQDENFNDVPENENLSEEFTYIDLQKIEPTTDNYEPADSVPNTSEPIELNAINIQNLERLEPRDVSQYIENEKIKTQRFHIVRKDQTLSAISREYYGTANKWKKIFDANRDVLKDPNKINQGMKLIIPD